MNNIIKEKEIETILNESSSEEGPLIRTGDVPKNWYDIFEHNGYNIDGKTVKSKNKVSVQDCINFAKNKHFVIYDELNDEKVVIPKKQLKLIQKLRKRKIPLKIFDPFADYKFFNEVSKIPIKNHKPSKLKNGLSKNQLRQISRECQKLRKSKLKDKKSNLNKSKSEKIFSIWNKTDSKNKFEYLSFLSPIKRYFSYERPVKRKLPKTEESYNPPENLLFDSKKQQEWLETDPEDRKTSVIPKKYLSLSEIPYYKNLIKENNKRLISLFAQTRDSLNKNIEKVDRLELIPKIDTQKFRPFPSKLRAEFKGLSGNILSISCTNELLAASSSERKVIIWEIESGRQLKTLNFDNFEKTKVKFSPNFKIMTALSSSESKTEISFFFSSDFEFSNRKNILKNTLFKEKTIQIEKESTEILKSFNFELDFSSDSKISLSSKNTFISSEWHKNNKYFAIITKESPHLIVLKVNDGSIQVPFTKNKKVLDVKFSTREDLIFILFERKLVVYNYKVGQITKTLQLATSLPCTFSVCPSGTNIAVGCLNRSMWYFDMELSEKPFKKFKVHKKSFKTVEFHKKLPLLATSSNDGSVFIFYAKRADDFSKPTVAPVNILGNLKKDGKENFYKHSVFHPTQPWVFCGGVEKLGVRMYVD